MPVQAVRADRLDHPAEVFPRLRLLEAVDVRAERAQPAGYQPTRITEPPAVALLEVALLEVALLEAADALGVIALAADCLGS